ncbi:acyl-CoA dehydrogenase family protein [Paenibacillus sp. CGMCC 1.16610]|uniref:Monooxygenase n=1 Tax=Paenibacillus anseongense TaxID=2682845 RepID=A0ABW9U6Z8_9BACL|nr:MULTISPECIES: acyl-CoA dehydrogenase family protein [Paenibacillus]MBA2938844.1 acyl-CoA dehydrogenase family protein [Paenibacillus sp. CGMCC 1.16610]MVQ34806.1 monooxygenase [Paenibacillus anseongense]
MGRTEGVWGGSPSDNYEKLAERFRPTFQQIREGAVDRERSRKLLHEEMEWLRECGFGTVRISQEDGGFGATLPELFGLLIELSEADSNVTQALRIHFGFVERVLNLPDGERKQRWLKRIAGGAIVGNALTEIGENKVGSYATTLSETEDRLRLNGVKYYSTGTIYADWIVVSATAGKDDIVSAMVSAAAEGVDIVDDWAGFGQTLTGSGTTKFVNTPVEREDVFDRETYTKYGTAFAQMVHLATLSGISRAAARDVAGAVAERRRTYSHASAARAGEDPQVLQVVGRTHSQAYAAGAIVLKAAEAVQRAYDAQSSEDAGYADRVNVEAEVEVAQAQTIVARLVLEATAAIFDALGASATDRSKALDRYWRNARTIASHNPLIYKERIIGDYVVNGMRPPFAWQTGIGEPSNTDQTTGDNDVGLKPPS